MTTYASDVAKLLNAELAGENIIVHGVSGLDSPRTGTVVFTRAPVTPEALPSSGFLLLAPDGQVDPLPVPSIRVANPRLALAVVAGTFFRQSKTLGIASGAHVHPDARVAATASVAPGAVIEAGVEVGDHTTIGPNVVLHTGTRIGKRCAIAANSAIGTVGFGFERDAAGKAWRIPHVGGVMIEDDVEIGALCSIARGTFGQTTLGRGTQVDDHVFIAHNVKTGRDCLIIAGAEVSGSVTMGARVWIGPQASIRNKITIGDDALIGMGAVVVKDVAAGAIVAGNPAKEMKPREER